MCSNFRKAPSLRHNYTHILHYYAKNTAFYKNPDIDTSTSISAGHGEPERRGDRVQRAPRGERRRQRGSLGEQLPHLLHEAPGGGLIISGKTLQGEKSFKIDTPSEEENLFFPETKETQTDKKLLRAKESFTDADLS